MDFSDYKFKVLDDTNAVFKKCDGNGCYLSYYDGNDLAVSVPDEHRFPDGELKSVVRIAGYVFANRPNLQSVQLPASLQTIDAHAFTNCDELKIVNIPQTLQEVETKAFYKCEKLSLYTDLAKKALPKTFQKNWNGAHNIIYELKIFGDITEQP